MKQGFILDMDGVIYRGNELVAGADEFVEELKRRSLPFMFLTNNSQRTRRDIVTRLAKMGIRTDESHVFTSAMATALFVAHQKTGGTAYVIGEGGLHQALHAVGFAIVDHDPDFVIIGEGRTFTLENVEAAIRHVLRGARLIATNLDSSCPTSDGLRPGCGATVSMIESATGLKAFGPGKPSPVMLRAARKQLGLETAGTTIIGDTMETDIRGGVEMGYRTILVLSGGTKLSEIGKYAYRPDRIIDSVASLDIDEWLSSNYSWPVDDCFTNGEPTSIPPSHSLIASVLHSKAASPAD